MSDTEYNLTTIDGKEFKLPANLGSQLAVKVVEYRPAIKTVHGTREAWKCDIVAMEDGLYYENVLVFGKGLIRQINEGEFDLDRDGDWAVVGLTQTEPKEGHEAGTYLFTAPSTSGIRLAARYGL